MMDCSQFREVVADVDRPGVLSADLRERALAHAETCSECGQLLTETESLDSELRRLISKYGNAQAPVRVEAQLLGAFRAHKAAAARRGMRRFAAVIGIAAMMLVSVGIWYFQRTYRGNPSAVVDVAQNEPMTQPKPETGTAQTPAVVLGASAAAAASRPVKRAASGPQPASEDSAAFIPLPDAEEPISLDDGAVVQVVMPRADLASFGLPLEAMEGSGMVRADLIVSADGTPQAIRVISRSDETDSAVQR